MSGSARWTLDRDDFKKLGKSFLLCLAGGVIAFLATVSTEVDWGMWGPIVGVICTFLVNLIRKWISDNTEPSMPVLDQTAVDRYRENKSARTIAAMLTYLLMLFILFFATVVFLSNVFADASMNYTRKMENFTVFGHAGNVSSSTAQVTTSKTYLYSVEVSLKSSTSAIALQDALKDKYANSRDGIPIFEYMATGTPIQTEVIQFDRPFVFNDGLILEVTNAVVKLHYAAQ